MLVQRLADINERAQRCHKVQRRLALSLLALLEPTRLENYTTKQKYQTPANVLEDSFLFDLPTWTPTFKPQKMYKPNHFVTLRPSPQFVNALFKRRSFSKINSSEVATMRTSVQSPHSFCSISSIANEFDSNAYMVMEELENMQANSHVSEKALAHLALKYPGFHKFHNSGSVDKTSITVADSIGHQKSPCVSISQTDAEFIDVNSICSA